MPKKITKSEISSAVIISVEETGRYFLDKRKHICKEIIHSINHKDTDTKGFVFKRINSEQIDMGVFERFSTNMVEIPNYIVVRMHII